MVATIKVNACYTVKSYKNKLKNKFKQGRGGGRRVGAGSAFTDDTKLIQKLKFEI